MTSPSSKVGTPVPSNQQPPSTYQSSTTFGSTTSSSDWTVNANKCLPLYARPQMRTPTMQSHNLTNSVSSSVASRPYSSSSNNQPESNMLFNQLAAQLLIQQQGASTNPSVQSYYPSPSYTDPAIIGMGHLSTSATGNGTSTPTLPPVKPAYSNPYQGASNEYESLNSLLNSSFGHHQNGDFSMPHANASAFAPPPGFGGVATSQSAGMGGANTTVPPPSLRPYYNTQLPPPAGLPLQPSQHASFATFNSFAANTVIGCHPLTGSRLAVCSSKCLGGIRPP
ncbi:unnamed protein product [Strongylus vulgaris]|uniref:Uncharacterized protein n=1 Tax=Strongylus vulgaris TaxID=40348 RepID=A0A3P7KBC6_STRVU|nr:unnamed protein product [Strongylus vulgaris]